MEVALFIPCYIDQFYPQVGIATLQLLQKLGCKVIYPEKQTCCGQPMANSGFHHLTEGCNHNFIKNFDGYDYIVSPSGSCTLHLKEHLPHEVIASKVYELCEFLTDVLKVESLSANFPHRVGLHTSCHALRGLHIASMSEINAPVFSKPEQLLKMVKGITVSKPKRSDECCGFGGTFCVTEEAVSVKMGKDRIKQHQENEVEYITGVDISCLMHIEGILRRDNSKIQVKHIAEILNQS